jgi:hypothetical protein
MIKQIKGKHKIVSTNGLFDFYDDGHLDLNFHEGQQRIWNSEARFILGLAGSQGGKTSFAPWWLYREILKRGSGDYLAVTTSFDQYRLKMLPEMRRVFEGILRIGRYWPGARIIELRDPSVQGSKFLANRVDDEMWGRIILRSANAPAGLESATAKAAWLDEVGQDEWDVTTWEAIQRRVALNTGRVLGTTTIYNLGWIKQLWYDKWLEGNKDYDVIQFASVSNPSFPQEEFERARATLPTWRFEMFYLGEFSRPAGLIYGDFRDHMVVPSHILEPHWRRIVGIDFGGANTAAIFLCEDQTVTPSKWYVYDEYHGGGLSTREHVEHIKEMLHGATDVTFVGGAPGETQYRMDWQNSGMDVQQPQQPEVEVGISSVVELLKTDRLRVFKHCNGLRHELGTYKRKLDENLQPTEQIDQKQKFHRLDALRYAVSEVELFAGKSFALW